MANEPNKPNDQNQNQTGAGADQSRKQDAGYGGATFGGDKPDAGADQQADQNQTSRAGRTANRQASRAGAEQEKENR